MIKRKQQYIFEPLSINQIGKKKRQQNEFLNLIPEPVQVMPKKKKKNNQKFNKQNYINTIIKVNNKQNINEKEKENQNQKCAILKVMNLSLHNYTKSQHYQEILEQTNRLKKQKQNLMINTKVQMNVDTPIHYFFQSSNKENIDSLIDDSFYSITNIQSAKGDKQKQKFKLEGHLNQNTNQLHYWMSMAKKYHNILTSEKIKVRNLQDKMKVLVQNTKTQNNMEINQLQRKIQSLNSQLISKNKEIKQKQQLISRILANKKT